MYIIHLGLILSFSENNILVFFVYIRNNSKGDFYQERLISDDRENLESLCAEKMSGTSMSTLNVRIIIDAKYWWLRGICYFVMHIIR